MKEVVSLLPVLLTAMLMNIMAGTYFNIGKENIAFDWKKLTSGIIKAGIAGGIFIGTAYCFEAIDLSSIGVTPVSVMLSAISLYTGKALIALGRILGIDVKK